MGCGREGAKRPAADLSSAPGCIQPSSPASRPCKDGGGQGERREDEQGEEVGDDPASGDPAEGFLEDLGDDVAEQEHEDQRLVGTKIRAVALQHFALVNLRVRRVSTEAIGGQEQQDAGHKLINQSILMSQKDSQVTT